MKLKKKLTAIETTLGELATLLPQAAAGYLDVLQAPRNDRAAAAEKVSALESEADDRHLALVRDVGNTFITPYDREDLFGLLESLDDIIDAIDLASRTCAAVPVDLVADEVIDSGRNVQQMAELMSRAVSLIKDPEDLVKTLVQANQQYASIRSNYITYLARLLEDDGSPIEAIRGRLLVDQIETIAGEMESFGRSLGVMAIKET